MIPGRELIRHVRLDGTYDLDQAIRRARRRAARSGVRQRVEICRHEADEHFLGKVWGDTHFVIRPTDAPAGAS